MDILSCITEIIDINQDILDSGIEDYLDEDFLSVIPGVGSVFKLLKLTKNINSAYLYKKLATFLYKISDIEVEKRVAFYNNHIEKDKEFTGKILLYLEKADEVEKATLIGSAFKKLIYCEIDKDKFFRLCNIIEKVYIGDLRFLEKSSKYYTIEDVYVNEHDSYPKKIVFNKYIDNIESVERPIEEGIKPSEYKDIEAHSLQYVGITREACVGEYTFTNFGMEVFKILYR